MLLFVFEFLGTTELVVILAAALVLFGPRRLPELGRTIGKSLAEFKRTTDDFKRTWEREVEIDKLERDIRIDTALNSPDPYTPPALSDAPHASEENATSVAGEVDGEEKTIARRKPAAAPVDARPDGAPGETQS